MNKLSETPNKTLAWVTMDRNKQDQLQMKLIFKSEFLRNIMCARTRQVDKLLTENKTWVDTFQNIFTLPALLAYACDCTNAPRCIAEKNSFELIEIGERYVHTYKRSRVGVFGDKFDVTLST